MPSIDPHVDILLLLDPTTGERGSVLVSPEAGSNEPSELWWERGSTHYVLFDPDEFYDAKLRARRESGNMISPRDSTKRLVLVGPVFGVPLYESRFIEIARAQLDPTGGSRGPDCIARENAMYPYAGSMSEKEFVELWHARSALLPRSTIIVWRLCGWFAAGFCGLALWAILGSSSPAAAAVFGVLCVVCLACGWRLRPDPKRAWETMPQETLRSSGRVTETTLEATLFNAEARLPWQLFQALYLSDSVAVLVVGPHLVVPIARSMFPGEDDWLSATTLMKARVAVAKGQAEGQAKASWAGIAIWLALMAALFVAWYVQR